MKNKLVPILIVLNVLILVILIGFASFLFLAHTSDIGTFDEDNFYPEAIVKLEDSDNIECEAVFELIESLALTGYDYIRINDFLCSFSFNEFSRYDDPDSITLAKNQDRPHNLAMMPPPEEQYDLDKLHGWCEQHEGQYAQIAFGSRVKFNCMESISKILLQYSIQYHLAELLIGNQDKDIIIQLYQ